MRNLIRIESYKLLHGMAVKVMACIVVAYAGLIIGMYQLMAFLFEQSDAFIPDMGGMPTTFHLTGLIAFASSDMYSVLQIMMLVLVASLFTSEYSRATLKIMLVIGTRRSSLYLSKFAVLGMTLFAFTLLGAVVVTALATLVNGWGDSFSMIQLLQLAGAALRITVLNLTYGAILAALAILTKSTGIIIAIGIGIQFAEGMATTLVQLADHSLLDFLGKLLPSGYAMSFAALTVETGLLLRGLTGSVIVIAIVLVVGIRLFNKQDIPV